jgi:flagellar biosynthesis/type III secretory pathway protein FliH
MEEKFEEGVEKGMDLGREEGYTVAKKGFDEIIKVIKAREAPKKAYTTVYTQATPKTTTTTSFSVQTNNLTAAVARAQDRVELAGRWCGVSNDDW